MENSRILKFTGKISSTSGTLVIRIPKELIDAHLLKKGTYVEIEMKLLY